MKIISIQGPWAVGKSTLIRNLLSCEGQNIKTFKEFGNIEDKIEIEFNYNLLLKSDFLLNQLIYFRREYTRYLSIKKIETEILLLNRGPEDTICFSIIHPKAIMADWNIEIELAKFKKRHIKYSSDKIIYLDASKSILYKRKDNDISNVRNKFNQYLEMYYEYEKDYFLSLRQVELIDTSQLTPIEVCEKVKNLVYG